MFLESEHQLLEELFVKKQIILGIFHVVFVVQINEQKIF